MNYNGKLQSLFNIIRCSYKTQVTTGVVFVQNFTFKLFSQNSLLFHTMPLLQKQLELRHVQEKMFPDTHLGCLMVNGLYLV